MKVKLLTIIALLTTMLAGAQVVERTLPQRVKGVKQEQILLNGIWQFQFSPDSKWTTITVPGEVAMQGYAIEHDKAVTYKKDFAVPADFANKAIILRFDGVYSHAEVWVNGTFVRNHDGGFTRWECDVTKLIKPGRKNEIRMEVTDRRDDISYGSGYAHHPIGGILRDVTLYALPQNHLTNFYAETLLDTLYQDADLRIGFHSTAAQKVGVKLSDPSGKVIVNSSIEAKAGENIENIAIKNPMKWDAEHPELYTLQITAEGYEFSRLIGFRDVKIVGNVMQINGKAIKLRGACRHDIHPTLGRTTNRELDSLDADIFKRSNMNFVRTSHYPPSEVFLEFCDKMGLYVECETAICFVDTYRQKNYAPAASQDDPKFTDKYMGQLQEMVTGYRSHASIIFWSIGNESIYGTNFQKSYDWTKATDQRRPVIFSYPGTVGKEHKAYEIISMHYPSVVGTMTQFGISVTGFQNPDMPSLFDEWAHVPCYTYTTLQDDPNIREFWGASLDMMWSKLFNAKGGLGGAIWGYIDETFMVPQPKVGTPWWIEGARTAKPEEYQGNCIGYGEWGIVDVWRREKPEFWGTKKAYSPIRLQETQVNDFTVGEPIILPVYNRFDHTCLSEVTARFTYKSQSQSVKCPVIAPHSKGAMAIPAQNWSAGDEVVIEFLDSDNRLIDAYTVSIGGRIPATKIATRGSLTVEQSATQVVVKGEDFTIPFDKASGLIRNATSKGEVVIECAPLLNLDLNVSHKTGAEVREKASNYIVQDKDWKRKSFSYTESSDRVSVALSGSYLGVDVTMKINISANGRMEIDYLTQGEPNGWLRESGLKFYLPSTISTLNWSRRGYWSYYPQGDFAALNGTAPLYNAKRVAYGEDPNQSWNMDTHNYYYFADRGANCEKPLTNIAKGMKENIFNYTLQGGKGAISVSSTGGDVAARINKRSDEQLILYVNNRWDYPEIAWGDYCKALDVNPCYGKVTLDL